MRYLLLIGSLALWYSAFSQYQGLKRIYADLKQGECIQIDTIPVDPSSIVIPGYSETDYEYKGAELCWNAQSADSVLILYRVVYIEFLVRHKDPLQIRSAAYDNPFNYIPNAGQNVGGAYGQLSTAGNISRGIGFGNAQDIVVNSNLNLRINGMLPGDIEIIAVISDENNPIQPEGNTQQIQDFDQVFITFSRDSNALTVGDFLMNSTEPLYFMKYYKKSRGAQIKTSGSLGNWSTTGNAELAISRGRFNRNQIDGIEGNSGPYRLNGVNGEQFIIIIAGTEVVYLDGKKLTRGEDFDYVINYNTGEITFTPSVIITRYSRIVVEFQYSDRNYARTVSHAGAGLSNENWMFYAHFFNEMDLKNQPFQQNLDSSLAIDLIRNAGDNQAFMENITAYNKYNADRIMYRKVDSLGTGIYVYSDQPESDSVFYEVRFSNVGAGNGSYVQVQSAANGKVFEYRGPGMGDYEPVQVLIAPRSMNMLVFGARHGNNRKMQGFEFAYSNNDENSRSALDDANNTGFGLKFYQSSARRLRDSSKWELRTDFNYELVSSNFQYIERYRGVEFDRSWNKTLSNPAALKASFPAYENILNAQGGIYGKGSNHYQLGFSTFLRPNSFEGYNPEFSFHDAYYPWLEAFGSASYLQAKYRLDSSLLGNNFYRLMAGLELPFKPMLIGTVWEQEKSAFRDLENDSLNAAGYGYEQFRAYLRNHAGNKLDYSLEFVQRRDELPQDNEFKSSTLGRNYAFKLGYNGKSSNRITFNTIYRTLDILDTTISNKNAEHTLQSRIEFDYTLLKKLLRTRTFFQLGTGQEQRKEFQYLQVQPGNGVYIWNDYDSNSIKTLNEFEIASELDRIRADYIRIYVPVPGFFTTNTNKFSETFEINPSALISKKTGLAGFAARFNSLSSIILENKMLPSGVLALLNPGYNKLEDSALINRSESFRTSLFFNRRSPVFGMDYTYFRSGSKLLLTNGFDSRFWHEHQINTRLNIKKSWTFRTETDFGEKRYLSEFFSQRNYLYTYLRLKPGIQYQYRNSFRMSVDFAIYKAQNNVEFGGEHTNNFELGTDIKFTRAEKGSFESSFNYIKVDFTGNPNSTLGYELLNGLQDGNNITWNLTFQRRFAGNIQMIVRYDGRKSQEVPVIHIGNLVARYLF